MGDYEARSLYTEGMPNVERCQSEDSLVESRSGQVENGTPSTSPPYWDTDEEDDDCGLKPSALYGKFTWKIEKFSQINKRELRSNAFEVGGYKWYILIYPQGCDVCNHLSLFLCVANHDKLLPGWSHFAQFTISVVNKDPKKSKYSDTLHRFWKKEHDWGWKKFMELSKVADGFVNDDCLVIKAQVQVIREKAHRPFRCLDCNYRRELVRVYLSNVEQICRRFIEERKGKLNKLIEDKARWSSFRAFWLGIDQSTRRRMSRDKTDAILKVVVKNFFIEKEVTSTLVMDSLYSGLKALEYQSKSHKGKQKLVEIEEAPAPIVCSEKDMFVLTDDVLLLLERAAVQPLPHQPLPPKDDKGSQNRTKDASSGDEFNKDPIERDERRLTELGRRTIEILVLVHIFSSRIEVAYQEAVALKRQEELIREEEAAEQAESGPKTRRSANEKEKRLKKKQAKQKRNSRKGKDKTKDEKVDARIQEKHLIESASDEIISEDYSPKQARVNGETDTLQNASDTSDMGDAEVPTADLENIDRSPITWETDKSEIHPATEASAAELQSDQMGKRTSSILDDSSSTCSTDSMPSMVNGSYKGNSSTNGKNLTSPTRRKNHTTEDKPITIGATQLHGSTVYSRPVTPEPDAIVLMKEQVGQLALHHDEKLHGLPQEEEFGSPEKKLIVKDPVDKETRTISKSADSPSPSSSPMKKPSPTSQHQLNQSSDTTNATKVEPSPLKEQASKHEDEHERSVPPTRSPQPPFSSRFETQKSTLPPKVTSQQTASVSRPYSAPLTAAPRPTAPVVPTIHSTPLLSRSVSAAGRLGTEPSPFAPSYIPQSYLNVMMGKTPVTASTPGPSHFSSSQGFLSATSSLPPPTNITFGSMKPETLAQTQLLGHDEISNLHGLGRLNIHGRQHLRAHSHNILSSSQGSGADEFPHLDIINDLLEEDRNVNREPEASSSHYYNPNFNRQYSFPGNDYSLFDLADPHQHYNEGLFGRMYGSSRYSPQFDIPPYSNTQMEGANQNHWPYGTSTDPRTMGSGNTGTGGYPDYPNMNGTNGYPYRRPGNGR